MAKKAVKIGVIGVGNMGSQHVRFIDAIPNARLMAIADHDSKKIESTLDAVSNADDIETFEDGMAMIRKADIDAITIATPHYDHPPLTKAAFKRGLHVMCEKPVAVTAKAAAEVNAAYKKLRKKPIWGAMFQQRTSPQWQAVKRIIDAGELGEIQRVNWIITNWFRSQAYYDSGGWRATWAGEGGGVLINQCPHNLDLIQWFCGMPHRVTANVGLGKYHDIEVEDDVTAILEYPNGATGVFVTTTGDAPGTNRLEITGDNGRLIVGDGKFELLKNHESVKHFSFTTDLSFGRPDADVMQIKPGGKDGGHKVVMQAFVNAIQKNDKSLLVAEAIEGINALELGNAMLMSGLTGEPVDIPTPRAKFDRMMKELAAKSKTRKPKKVRKAKVDMCASFWSPPGEPARVGPGTEVRPGSSNEQRITTPGRAAGGVSCAGKIPPSAQRAARWDKRRRILVNQPALSSTSGPALRLRCGLD